MNIKDIHISNRLQLFPHNKGWAIFDENTFRFSKEMRDFAAALNLAKTIAQKNEATLMVRDTEGEIILKTIYK